jgi:hypothetical protein
MVNLGDLSKLLDQGHITTEYVFQSQEGDFKFKMRTLTPLEDVEATSSTEAERLRRNIKEDDSGSRVTLYAIEVLSRAIENVNGISLESVPGAQGESALGKRRYIIQKLGEKLILALWKAYNKMRTDIQLDGTEAESEAIKK